MAKKLPEMPETHAVAGENTKNVVVEDDWAPQSKITWNR
jgi:hypothetical protein